MAIDLSGVEWADEWSTARINGSGSTSSPGDKRSDFERDRARIIHSVAFRRLQGKTQIFASGWTDFLRTRVTHSIEVSQIGRALARTYGLPDELVEAACLGHDLGHPPFGHTGEGVLNDLMWRYGGFEGNAQTFRVVTRLEAKSPNYVGLDLCRATLHSLLKYPYLPGGSKFIYQDDVDVYEKWLYEGTGLGLLPNHVLTEELHRTLACQLMDWADDIAYSVHDLEDGIASGFLHPRYWSDDRFAEAIHANLTKAPIKWRDGTVPTLDTVSRVLDGLSRDFGKYGEDVPRDVIREFTRSKIDLFATAGSIDEIDKVGHPLFRYVLVIPEDIRVMNAVMKAITFEFVIRDDRTATLAFKGTEVLRRLFRVLRQNALGEDKVEMTDDGGERKRPLSRMDRYLLFPRSERPELESLGDDVPRVCRYVCDYLASMTEGQAMALYARLFEPSAGFALGV